MDEVDTRLAELLDEIKHIRELERVMSNIGNGLHERKTKLRSEYKSITDIDI